MSTSNKDFFARFTGVRTSPLQHDDIHAVVAGGATPLFYSIKENFDAAEVHEYLFQAMGEEVKDQLILEEVLTLAYERVIIPAVVDGGGNDREQHLAAFDRYLRKIGGTLKDNPEWIRDYAAMHYDRLWLKVQSVDVHGRMLAAISETL